MSRITLQGQHSGIILSESVVNKKTFFFHAHLITFVLDMSVGMNMDFGSRIMEE